METFTYVRTCGNASAAETVIFSSQCSVHSFTNIHSLPYAQITIMQSAYYPHGTNVHSLPYAQIIQSAYYPHGCR